MVTVRYRPPSAAAWRTLATGPEIRGSLWAVGEKAKTHAEQLAASHVQSGEYERSFQLVALTILLSRHWRAAVQLQNLAAYAAAIEWGSYGDRTRVRVKSQPQLIFTRTLEWLGAQS